MLLSSSGGLGVRRSLPPFQPVILRGWEHCQGSPDGPGDEWGTAGIVVKLKLHLLRGLRVKAHRLARQLVRLGVALYITLGGGIMPIAPRSMCFHPAHHRALHCLVACPR